MQLTLSVLERTMQPRRQWQARNEPPKARLLNMCAKHPDEVSYQFTKHLEAFWYGKRGKPCPCVSEPSGYDRHPKSAGGIIDFALERHAL